AVRAGCPGRRGAAGPRARDWPARARARARASRAGRRSRPHLAQHPALAVHALVIGAELAFLDRPPPRLVGAEPLDRLADALLERDRRLPAREPRELRAVDGVAAVGAPPVFGLTGQRAWPAAQPRPPSRYCEP